MIDLDNDYTYNQDGDLNLTWEQEYKILKDYNDNKKFFEFNWRDLLGPYHYSKNKDWIPLHSLENS